MSKGVVLQLEEYVRSQEAEMQSLRDQLAASIKQRDELIDINLDRIKRLEKENSELSKLLSNERAANAKLNATLDDFKQFRTFLAKFSH